MTPTLGLIAFLAFLVGYVAGYNHRARKKARYYDATHNKKARK